MNKFLDKKGAFVRVTHYNPFGGALKNMSDDKLTNFEKDLKSLINRYSLENGSNTPDFILAKYLVSCLENFNNTVKTRQNWYAHYPGQNERDGCMDKDDGDIFIGTSTGTEKDIMRSVFSCNHANEVPSKCSCPGECYCRRNTCQVKMKGPYPQIELFQKETEFRFMCTCMGNGKGGHSVGCFDDIRNHCPDCNSFLYTSDWKTKIECPDTFGKCKKNKQLDLFPKEIDENFNDD